MDDTFSNKCTTVMVFFKTLLESKISIVQNSYIDQHWQTVIKFYNLPPKEESGNSKFDKVLNFLPQPVSQ